MSRALDDIFADYADELDTEIRSAIPPLERHPLYRMLHYHLGWADAEGRVVETGRGKRVRPTMLLLCAEAAGGDRRTAMPAAAAVELLHNFSLIHDDIQDRSPERRHRPAVWSIWGDAQAINAGDAMHALAARAALRSAEVGASADMTIAVAVAIHECCARLVEGQYLDLSFERRNDVSTDAYFAMISGKTAALLGASTEIGALLGGAATTRDDWRLFGEGLGLAFQVVDDVLGVWADQRVTGKPTADDVVRGKRSLPFLYALEVLPPADATRLRQIYDQAERDCAAVAEAVELIDRAGARATCEARARALLDQAIAALDRTDARAPLADDLRALASFIVERQS